MKLARLFFKHAAARDPAATGTAVTPRDRWGVQPGVPIRSGLPEPETGRSPGQRAPDALQEAQTAPESPRRPTAFSNMGASSNIPGARGAPAPVGPSAARAPGMTPSMFGDTAAGPRIGTSAPPAATTPGRGGRNWRSWATHLLAGALGATGVGGTVGLAQLRGARARRAAQDAAGAAPTPDPTESEIAVTGEDPEIHTPADQSDKPATSKTLPTDRANDGPPQATSDSQSPQGRWNWQQVAPQLLIGSGIGAAALLAYLLTSRDDERDPLAA